MTFDYNKEHKTSMSLVLENGISVEGEFIDLRITVDTLPTGKQWYQIRHCDDDGSEPASLKRGGRGCKLFRHFHLRPDRRNERR